MFACMTNSYSLVHVIMVEFESLYGANIFENPIDRAIAEIMMSYLSLAIFY